jgi:hypothetical protein
MMSSSVLLAVVKRPRLWGEGLRSLLAVAPRDWWRRAPFLPVPDRDYAAWRVATAHGNADSELSAEELVSYLDWRRRQHRPLRRV